MDNQWLLYGISSVVLIILIRRTILSGNIVLSCLLGAILLIQVVGVALCAQQKKKNEHTKELPSSKVHQKKVVFSYSKSNFFKPLTMPFSVFLVEIKVAFSFSSSRALPMAIP